MTTGCIIFGILTLLVGLGLGFLLAIRSKEPILQPQPSDAEKKLYDQVIAYTASEVVKSAAELSEGRVQSCEQNLNRILVGYYLSYQARRSEGGHVAEIIKSIEQLTKQSKSLEQALAECQRS